MNRTIIIIAVLIALLVAAWVALSIGGRQTQPLDQAQPPAKMPAQPSPIPDAPTPQGGTGDKLTSSDKGEGNVNISATYINDEVLKEDPSLTKPAYDQQDEIVFLVVMNTHVVDLSAYKMEERTVLKDAAGNEYEPAGGWQSVQEAAGHHRSGYLRFNRVGKSGKDLTQGEGSLTLIVKGVADVSERNLVWELPLPPAGK